MAAHKTKTEIFNVLEYGGLRQDCDVTECTRSNSSARCHRRVRAEQAPLHKLGTERDAECEEKKKAAQSRLRCREQQNVLESRTSTTAQRRHGENEPQRIGGRVK